MHCLFSLASPYVDVEEVRRTKEDMTTIVMQQRTEHNTTEPLLLRCFYTLLLLLLLLITSFCVVQEHIATRYATLYSDSFIHNLLLLATTV